MTPTLAGGSWPKSRAGCLAPNPLCRSPTALGGHRVYSGASAGCRVLASQLKTSCASTNTPQNVKISSYMHTRGRGRVPPGARSGAHRTTHPDSQAVLRHVPCQRIQLFSPFLLIFPFVVSLSSTWAPHRAPVTQPSASQAQTSPVASGLSTRGHQRSPVLMSPLSCKCL